MKNTEEIKYTTWHLAKSDLESKVTEFEFIFWRLYYSFLKWQEDCYSCISSDEISVAADEITLVHLIRMLGRPKTIYEIARLMNRDDMPNLQYSIRKLLRLKLIKKAGKNPKRSTAYEATDKGIRFTDEYGNIRRNLLIKIFEDKKEIDWETVCRVMNECKNVYDEAGRLTALTKEKSIT